MQDTASEAFKGPLRRREFIQIVALTVLQNKTRRSFGAQVQREKQESQSSRFDPLPKNLAEHIIYPREKANVPPDAERLWIGIHHQHGSPLHLPKEKISLHLRHQHEVLQDLQSFLSHYGSETALFFLESFKGPMQQWDAARFAAIDRAWKKHQEFEQGEEAQQRLAAELGERLAAAKSEEEKWKVFEDYDAKHGFAGSCLVRGLTSIVYGSEPPWWDPSAPTFKKLPEGLSPLEALDAMNKELERVTREIPEKHRKRNEYAAQYMDKTVPKGKVGVIDIGALHFGIVPRTKVFQGIDGLEVLFGKIPKSHTLILETPSFRELQRGEK